ncbi:MAG: copper resistance protein B [Gemmatimonadota bacterium]
MAETTMRNERKWTARLVPGVLSFVLTLALGLGTAAPVDGQVLMKLENENPYGYALFDILEVAPGLDDRPARWDMIAFYGKQYQRLWIKSEGDISTLSRSGEFDLQALYSRVFAPYWEVQVGGRVEVDYEGEDLRSRGHLVLGLEGLAPYWFELEPSIYISENGDVSAEFAGSLDLFVTQRLLLQPRLDVFAAVQEVPEWGISSGLNGVGLGLRMRYEITREFAPYLGIDWQRSTGGAADLARLAGREVSRSALVAGVRMWH